MKTSVIILLFIPFIWLSCSVKSQEHKNHIHEKNHKHHIHHNTDGHEHSEHKKENHIQRDHATQSSRSSSEDKIVLGKPELKTFFKTETMFGIIVKNNNTTHIITPRISGIVEKIHADIGDTVKKGTPLFTISSDGLIKLKEAFISSYEKYVLSRKSLDRALKLSEIKGIEKKELIRRDAEFKTSAASFFANRARLISTGIPAKVLKKTELFLQKRNTEKISEFITPLFTVRSGSPGTVITRDITQGAVVNKDACTFTISDVNSVWGIFDATTDQLKSLKKGEAVHVTCSAISAKTFKGRVDAIMETLDKKSHTMKVRVKIENRERLLKPNMYANVKLRKSSGLKLFTISTEALVTINSVKGVFIKHNSGFDFLPVKNQVTSSRGYTYIKELKKDHRVVIKGAFRLKAAKLLENSDNISTHGHSH